MQKISDIYYSNSKNPDQLELVKEGIKNGLDLSGFYYGYLIRKETEKDFIEIYDLLKARNYKLEPIIIFEAINYLCYEVLAKLQ